MAHVLTSHHVGGRKTSYRSIRDVTVHTPHEVDSNTIVTNGIKTGNSKNCAVNAITLDTNGTKAISNSLRKVCRVPEAGQERYAQIKRLSSGGLKGTNTKESVALKRTHHTVDLIGVNRRTRTPSSEKALHGTSRPTPTIRARPTTRTGVDNSTHRRDARTSIGVTSNTSTIIWHKLKEGGGK